MQYKFVANLCRTRHSAVGKEVVLAGSDANRGGFGQQVDRIHFWSAVLLHSPLSRQMSSPPDSSGIYLAVKPHSESIVCAMKNQVSSTRAATCTE